MKTFYINLYYQGWFHRAGKPGNVDIHAGDLYATAEAARASIDPVPLYLATVPVVVPDSVWVPDRLRKPNPPEAVPTPFRESRKAWINAARDLHQGLVGLQDKVRHGRQDRGVGICSNVPPPSSAYKETDYILRALFRQWPGSSGDEAYPVPHPGIHNPMNAYLGTADEWAGEYGANRKALLDWCVETLGKWLKEVQ